MAEFMTVPGLFPPPNYSHLAIVSPDERLVFTAGGVPLDEAGQLVGEGDLEVQTQEVLANLETALLAGSSSLANVVASTIYVVSSNPVDLSTVWEVVQMSALAGGPHTSTLLGVSCLGYAGQLVEITAVATVD